MASFDPKTDFLGRGWSFPPTFDRQTGEVDMVEDNTDIVQSLHILFSTVLRERVMLPEYGNTLQHEVFEEMNDALLERIKHMMSDAILFFEPRILLEDIEVRRSTEQDGRVDAHLTYVVRQTNVRNNAVYPFYLLEGTSLPQIGGA